MNSEELQYLKELLYIEDIRSIREEVKKIKNPIFLHIFAANYNWNSGFEVPKAILDNENCDFGTGLLMFYRADGYRLLESNDAISGSSFGVWKEFINNLYKKLLDGNFSEKSISYAPPLTKVQVFKLRKSNPNIPDVFLDKSPGNDVEIPVL